EKIQFSKNEIKEIERRLNKESINLASFILSKSSYNKLIEGKLNPPSKEEYEKHNVLFLDDGDWPEKLFKKSILEKN
ncbi:MAG: hypothetical protein ACPL1G_08830, partial [Thermodesulfovibrionales bacterium]